MSIYHSKSTTSLQATPLVTQRTAAGFEECSSFFQIFSIANAKHAIAKRAAVRAETSMSSGGKYRHVSVSHKTGRKQLLPCRRFNLTDASFYRQQIPSHESEMLQHAQEFSQHLCTPEDALHLEKTLASYQETAESSTIFRVIQNDCRGTTVQRQFRTKFRKQPPSDNSI